MFRLSPPLTHEYVANRYSIFLKTCEEHKLIIPELKTENKEVNKRQYHSERKW